MVVSVRDYGAGIPEKSQNQIFDRFYQIESQAMPGTLGLGLGLYICREIIHRHRGRIWVQSEMGKGSEFSFSLPTAYEK